MTVSTREADSWSVQVPDDASSREYEPAVRAVVARIAAWHEARGGRQQAVAVVAIEGSLVDTKPDAVACATALALWKDWHGSELQVAFENGEWAVVPAHASTGVSPR